MMQQASMLLLRHGFRQGGLRSALGVGGQNWQALSTNSAGTPYKEPSAFREGLRKFLLVALPTSGIGVLAYGFLYPDRDPHWPAPPPQVGQQGGDGETIVNWSGTHQATPRHYYQPESEEEVERIVAAAHEAGEKLRVVGSALSPNGIGLSDEGMLSMALLDKVLAVDKERGQVTVQAGCRVQQVADHLAAYGLTLQNYASIREQQIGGYTQVSAHGTGATIPPVDEQVVALKIVTPGQGTLRLSKDSNPELFRFARVALGTLGVVTELTLQCVPAHQLLEETFTASKAEIKRNHASWLRDFQHIRYMWLPYTESAVVVRSNPLKSEAEAAKAAQPPAFTEEQRLEPLRALLQQRAGKGESLEGLTAMQLRDMLLALAPLDKDWVVQVNRAEAEFWKRSAGFRLGYSDQLLGFDCGGQQWVLEVAFPVGPLKSMSSWFSKHKDIAYMEELLAEIERRGIPAHSPIEQRWTSSSSSPMSPASSSRPDDVHSWVGVIYYLPTDDPQERAAITDSFRNQYCQLVEQHMMPRYGAAWHWAKLEVPEQQAQLEDIKGRLARRFPVAKLNELRAAYDPKNILSNSIVDAVMPREQPGVCAWLGTGAMI